MRFPLSVLSSCVLAAFLLVTSIVTGLGQDQPDAETFRDMRREWINLAVGRSKFEVSDPSQVPSQLARAAEQSGCRFKLGIADKPVRFIVFNGRRLAIVFCPAVAHGSDQLFDLSDRNLVQPKLMELPFLRAPDGFATTARPGFVTWKDAGILMSETGSDNSCGRLRHNYRFDGNGFVVFRVEYQQACNQSGWTTLWDAASVVFPEKEK